MKLNLVTAGHYWTDAGAFFGVLPYFIWQDKVQTDERRRLKMNLNLLLIQADDRNILVDTGIGNRLNKRRKDIYNPSDFHLITNLELMKLHTQDITDVVLTHLHFDHAGGVVTKTDDIDVLTFPKAVHHIQKTEWDIAKNPDKLNKAAYQFEHQLSILEEDGKINLLNGDTTLLPGLNLRLTGGHTSGMQVIEAMIDGVSYIYAGDIIPTRHHLPVAVTSGYDVSRRDSVAAKEWIYNRLIETNGFLLLDHDTDEWQLPVSEILPVINY